MTIPTIQPAFSKGELAPALYGREDLAALHVGATTMRNMYVSYRGGAYSRPGTAFVGRCKESGLSDIHPRLIPFQFSTTQAYVLEFGTEYMRVVFQGAPVTEPPLAITNITQANPATMTVSGTFTAGDWIFVDQVAGMTQVSGNTYIVGGSGGSTFPLLDLDGQNLDTTGFSPYTGFGNAARIFTLATPYQAVDLPLLKYAQSADVMSLTHPSYPPMELKRFAADNWTLTPFSTASSIDPPAGLPVVTINTTVTGTPTEYAYVVTAVDSQTNQESIASLEGRLASPIDISASAGSITITWTPVASAQYYNIYKAHPSQNSDVPAGSLFGFMGSTKGVQFVDDNIVPDFTQTPPLNINPFTPGTILDVVVDNPGSGYTTFGFTITTATGSGAAFTGIPIAGKLGGIDLAKGGQNYQSSDTVAVTGDGMGATVHLVVGPASGVYPGVVSYFQQRRAYANTNNNPDTMWFSQPGAFTNFDKRIPVIDSDAITASPFAEQVDGVQWMIPMSVGLVTLTGRAAWQIEGTGSSTFNPQPITPANIEALSQAFNGCNAVVMPFKVNYDILYVQALGSKVRDLEYNFFTNLYTGTDITVLSSHLFDGYQIEEWAWCEDPLKIAWAVRNDGALLSLTYMKEQQVTGWARHDTQGLFWSVCAISEPPVNAAYFVTTRERPGKPRAYYIERLDNRLWPSIEDAWCVDCGVATVLTRPNADLAYSATSGEVIFAASGDVFTSDQVAGGWILRAQGGIARLTTYASPSEVGGVWLKPANLAVGGQVRSSFWSLGQPVTTVGGLTHLAGMTVIGIVDGVPMAPLVVPDDGIVTLPFVASDIKIGLAFTPQFQSVYLDEGQPTIQGRRKSIYAVTVRTDGSGGNLSIGSNQVDGSTLAPPSVVVTWSGLAAMPNLGNAYVTAGGQNTATLYSGDIRAVIRSDWNKRGQVAIEQDQPLPLSITAIIPEILPGDVPEVQIEQRKGQQ